MKKWLQKRLKNEKGLTLVELLAVIVILGIIAAIAVPSIGGLIDNTRIKAAHADAQNILSAANIYFVESPDAESVDLKTLLGEKYIDSIGTFTNGATENTVKVTKKSGGNTLSGTATVKGGTTIVYTSATSKDITDRGTKEGTEKNIEIK
ncbi:type II secretion system protein [Sporosarcina sp. ITBMC105]